MPAEGGTMVNEILASLNDAEKKQDAEILQKKQMLGLLMSYTSTSQVDYSTFTPCKILELAKFAVENAVVIEQQLSSKENAIHAISELPHLNRHRHYYSYM